MVTGTGTGVGKTWVAAGLLRSLAAAGRRVAARKPAQSFDPRDGSPTDAERLAGATGEQPEAVCPPQRCYPRAMAPPMAAAALGRAPFTIAHLVAEVQGSWPVPAPEVAVVEGAGGVAAPQADDGDTVALIAALAPDLVVVVADPALGALNLVRLSLAALGSHPVVVHLNRWDPGDDVAVANRRWLIERDGFTVTTVLGALAEMVDVGQHSDPGLR
ncbi:MAG: AAA family ATPase [Actinomycetota bacterium]|nr:AAA family ATPase [Actinomycetota bacterium]